MIARVEAVISMCKLTHHLCLQKSTNKMVTSQSAGAILKIREPCFKLLFEPPMSQQWHSFGIIKNRMDDCSIISVIIRL